MTKDEADILLAYYSGQQEKLKAMKRTIAHHETALRYIEALELTCKYAESDQEAMTEEEEDRLKYLSRVAAARARGEA